MKKLLLFGLVAAPCVAAAAGGADVPPSYEASMAQQPAEERVVNFAGRFLGKEVIVSDNPDTLSNKFLVFDPREPNIFYALKLSKGIGIHVTETAQLGGYGIVVQEDATTARIIPIGSLKVPFSPAIAYLNRVREMGLSEFICARPDNGIFKVKGISDYSTAVEARYFHGKTIDGRPIPVHRVKDIFARSARQIFLRTNDALAEVELRTDVSEIDLSNSGITVSMYTY